MDTQWLTIIVVVAVQIAGIALSYGSLRGLLQGRREAELAYRIDTDRRLLEIETRFEKRTVELLDEWRQTRAAVHLLSTQIADLRGRMRRGEVGPTGEQHD